MFQNDNDDDGAKFFFYDIKTKDDLCHAIPLIIIIEKKTCCSFQTTSLMFGTKQVNKRKKNFFLFFRSIVQMMAIICDHQKKNIHTHRQTKIMNEVIDDGHIECLYYYFKYRTI